MTYVTTMLALTAFLAFGWGVARLFSREGGIQAPMRILTALSTVFVILIMWLLVEHPAGLGLQVIASILFAGALALFAWSSYTIADDPFDLAFATGSPTRLLQSGPYAFIRNPFYTAYLLAWFGGAIGTQAIHAWGPFIVMVLFYVTAARREEAAFGTSALEREYHEYSCRTGRFLPRWPSRREADEQCPLR